MSIEVTADIKHRIMHVQAVSGTEKPCAVTFHVDDLIMLTKTEYFPSFVLKGGIDLLLDVNVQKTPEIMVLLCQAIAKAIADSGRSTTCLTVAYGAIINLQLVHAITLSVVHGIRVRFASGTVMSSRASVELSLAWTDYDKTQALYLEIVQAWRDWRGKQPL